MMAVFAARELSKPEHLGHYPADFFSAFHNFSPRNVDDRVERRHPPTFRTQPAQAWKFAQTANQDSAAAPVQHARIIGPDASTHGRQIAANLWGPTQITPPGPGRERAPQIVQHSRSKACRPVLHKLIGVLPRRPPRGRNSSNPAPQWTPRAQLLGRHPITTSYRMRGRAGLPPPDRSSFPALTTSRRCGIRREAVRINAAA